MVQFCSNWIVHIATLCAFLCTFVLRCVKQLESTQCVYVIYAAFSFPACVFGIILSLFAFSLNFPSKICVYFVCCVQKWDFSIISFLLSFLCIGYILPSFHSLGISLSCHIFCIISFSFLFVSLFPCSQTSFFIPSFPATFFFFNLL